MILGLKIGVGEGQSTTWSQNQNQFILPNFWISCSRVLKFIFWEEEDPPPPHLPFLFPLSTSEETINSPVDEWRSLATFFDCIHMKNTTISQCPQLVLYLVSIAAVVQKLQKLIHLCPIPSFLYICYVL